ncbi:MAG: transporter permease [Polyangiaceae bacterium]|jgi:NitT/TauT family transport system permease protein|nr:transporter permease [Polyangiaceae bacterium]
MASIEQSLPLSSHEPTRHLDTIAGAVRRALARSAAIILLLAIWELSPRLHLVEPAFLPPLSEVLATGWQLLLSGELLSHVRASLARSLLGFGLAIASGIPLGLLMGWYKGFERAVSPLLEALRNTASLALLPVFILLLGIGEASKVSLIVYACSWPILLNTLSGVRNVDPLLIKFGRTMGLSPFQLFRKVILPAAVPTIFVGIRLAGATSLVVLVAAEMIGAKAGLGYLIIYSQYNFQIPHMYLGIITITGIGLLFNELLQHVEARFTSWKAAAHE